MGQAATGKEFEVTGEIQDETVAVNEAASVVEGPAAPEQGGTDQDGGQAATAGVHGEILGV